MRKGNSDIIRCSGVDVRQNAVKLMNVGEAR